jgi:hypothetical protein
MIKNTIKLLWFMVLNEFFQFVFGICPDFPEFFRVGFRVFSVWVWDLSSLFKIFQFIQSLGLWPPKLDFSSFGFGIWVGGIWV